uniref:Uncharacterized protein n=1 Tax=Heliothis virescens TaxID=7102 RepID=A0A2A4J774_HELVI
MANLVLVVFCASLLICATFSLPVAQESTILASPAMDGRASVESLLLKFFKRGDDVQVGERHFRRKRSFIKSGVCPAGLVRLRDRCLTPEQYKRASGDEE